MRKLRNTMYVTEEDCYLSLEDDNAVVSKDKEELMRAPLLNLEGIVSYTYPGVSPALMKKCAKMGISISFFEPNGRFISRMIGPLDRNSVLRCQQYIGRLDEKKSLGIAQNCIVGKLHNSRWILERALRDHSMSVDGEKIKQASESLKNSMHLVLGAESFDQLRGYEGEAANVYFNVFDELILQQKQDFYFHGRNRRPPLDNVNALLSFLYSLLTNEVVSALEGAGLDPCAGYLHTDRSGKPSLALDLVEEFRAVMVDRFVLSLINMRMVNGKGFEKQEDGSVRMDDDTRKRVLKEWQSRKREIITHPLLKEKMEWGLVPHIQARLLARHIRGELDEYPVFLWK